MSQTTLGLAVVQPRTPADPDPRASAERISAYLAEAVSGGAELAVFPEGFPGPLRTTYSYDAEPAVARAAREHGCAVCWSRIERGEGERWHVVAYLHDREGERVARYVRAHPATGDVHATLSGVGLHPGEELVVAELGGLKVGLLICSELWLPEVSRVLATRGAEVLLAPAGGGFGRVAENWQVMTRARAVENECVVAMTSHIFGEDRGAAMIAGPEGVLASSETDEVICAQADLERLRWLRASDDSMVKPKPFAALPGTLRARRPQLYAELAEPSGGLFDYEQPEHRPAGE